MGNTLIYKFKGIDKLLKHNAPCTSHLTNEGVFKMYRKRLVPIDQECPIHTPYNAPDRYDVSRKDIEWIEYYVTNYNPVLGERYSQILMDSSIGPFLKWKDLPDGNRAASFRFDMNTPYRKMLFILSLMRYLEEYHEDVAAVLDYDGSEYLTPNQLLLTISLRLSWSNHAVFKPHNMMRGGYELCDELISAILSDKGEDIMAVSSYGYNTGPQSLFQELLDGRRSVPLPSSEVGEIINWLRGN